jgi:mannosyl-3-phosphoglycerate phosphatase
MAIPQKNSCVIFTDLDGTLLTHDTYSFEKAIPALKVLRESDIPLILCSSKTKGEILYYRRRLDNEHPFICENGGAIFLPVGYKDFKVAYTRIEGGYLVIELGTRREVLIRALKDIQGKTGVKLRGFSDMDVGELAELTNLPQEEARLALERHYSEPFVVEEGNPEIMLREIENMGLQWTTGGRGRFFHVSCHNDKGKAVRILSDIYRENLKDINWITIALGDALNDLPMLEAVDKAVLFKNKHGVYDPAVEAKHKVPLIYADSGAEGWGANVLKLIQQYCPLD